MKIPWVWQSNLSCEPKAPSNPQGVPAQAIKGKTLSCDSRHQYVDLPHRKHPLEHADPVESPALSLMRQEHTHIDADSSVAWFFPSAVTRCLIESASPRTTPSLSPFTRPSSRSPPLLPSQPPPQLTPSHPSGLGLVDRERLRTYYKHTLHYTYHGDTCMGLYFTSHPGARRRAPRRAAT